ncbi:MAG: SDR family NAD(P)-dependent oxidoreductase [Pseudomonadales bacterium]
MDKPTALITGASAGIGSELARIFADNGYDLVVTARREDRLAELAASLPGGCRVEVVPVDLAKAKGPGRLVDALAGRQIDVLVNNAGVLASGPFQSMGPQQMRGILQLNVRALTELTHALLPGMIERGGGRILNVASVAAFQPVPGLSLYGASKAFVLSFTESLSEDLRGTGVSVTALCPGPTRTDMVADIQGLELAGPFLSNARQVALEGYQACMAGEVVRVPGMINQALVSWTQYQPRWLVRMVSGMLARSTYKPAAKQ